MSAPRHVAPVELRHNWQRARDMPKAILGVLGGYGVVRRFVYRCPNCESWTANLPEYRREVCPAKDRRQGLRDRRQR